MTEHVAEGDHTDPLLGPRSIRQDVIIGRDEP